MFNIVRSSWTDVKFMVYSTNFIPFTSHLGSQQLTYIFFLLIAPGETPGPHLKALAKISRLLDDKFIRDRLRSVKSVEEILNIIKNEEQKNAK